MDVEEIYRLECLVDEKNDEIERLRATLDQTRRFALNGEMDTIVSDETERLREALRNVVAYANLPVAKKNWDLWELTITHARTALGEKE